MWIWVISKKITIRCILEPVLVWQGGALLSNILLQFSPEMRPLYVNFYWRQLAVTAVWLRVGST